MIQPRLPNALLGAAFADFYYEQLHGLGSLHRIAITGLPPKLQELATVSQKLSVLTVGHFALQ